MKLFSKIAYHSTTQKGLDKFEDKTSDEHIDSGEGAHIHGFGLYLQEDKQINIDRYKDSLPSTSVTRTVTDYDYATIYVDGVAYTVSPNANGEAIVADYGTFKEYDKLADGGDIPDYIHTDRKKISEVMENVITGLYFDKYPSVQDFYNNAATDEEKEFIDTHNVEIKPVSTEQEKEVEVAPSQYAVEIPDNMVLLNETDMWDDDNYTEFNRVLEEFSNETYGENAPEFEDIKGAWSFETLYEALTDRYDGDESETIQWFMNHGIDGIEYYGGMDGHCYVIYDCSKLRIIGEEE